MPEMTQERAETCSINIRYNQNTPTLRYLFTFWNSQFSLSVLFLPLTVHIYHPLTIQIDTGEELRVSQTQTDRQAPFTSQINKRQHKTQQTLAAMCHACVLLKQRNKHEIQVCRMQLGAVC
jgi:hypothetical protein